MGGYDGGPFTGERKGNRKKRERDIKKEKERKELEVKIGLWRKEQQTG